MKAEIIAIGSELTCGARLDTNSQWLSRQLESLGWTVQRHTTVADDREAMIQVYQEAARRSRVVLITGGLGPTQDDITRETLAAAFDQALIEDPQALQHIEALFASRRRAMPERNRVQALRPEHALTIHNAHGTAPGILMHLTDPDCTIAVMPGVPAEMKHMFQDQIVPALPLSGVFVKRTVIRTFGYGESDAEGLLGDLTARGRNPEVGITASEAVISLSVTARAGSAEQCQLLSDAVCEEIRERLGNAVFGNDEVELHQVVAEQLLQRGLRIAILEGSTTGGLIGQWFTESAEAATCVAHCQMFATAEAMPGDTADASAWEAGLRSQGAALLSSGQADFIILSSPSSVVQDTPTVRRQQGSIIVFGSGFNHSQDVSMTGNLAIFRQRAARTALNQLRLHLLQTEHSSGTHTKVS